MNKPEGARRDLLWLGLALCCGFLLRFYGLWQRQFWLDEGASLYFAGLDWPQLILSRALDPTPILFPLLLKFWLQFGDSELYLRLLPLSFGMAGLYFAYLAACQAMNSRRAGLCALWLLALAPLHVRYSQELRAYGLWFAFCALALYLLLLSLRRGGARNLIGLGAALAGAFYCHYASPLYWLALGLYAWLLARREGLNFARLGWAGLLCLGFVLPGLGQFWANLGQISHGFWIPAPDADAALRSLTHLLAPLPDFGTWGLAALSLPVLAGLWIFSYRAGVFCGALVLWLVPFGLAWLCGVFFQPILLARLLLPGLLGPALLFGGICASRQPNLLGLRRMFCVLCLGVLVFGDYVYFTHPEGGARGLEPWREVAEFLKSKSQADDAALFSPDAARLPYLWYAAKLAGKGPRCLGYPRTLDPGSEILYREDGAPESAETNLQAGLAPAGRVWLVSCGASGKARQARELIAQRGQSLGQYEFGRINLELFAIK